MKWNGRVVRFTSSFIPEFILAKKGANRSPSATLGVYTPYVLRKTQSAIS